MTVKTITGFAPVADEKALILILGSMPSTRSLQEDQYYGHPRNSFWFIMSSLFADNRELDYPQKKALLIDNRIALWDVLNSCQRKGSLDSSIENGTIVVNDFNRFLAEHPLIKAIYFNGSRAQQEYNRHVLPRLDKKFSSIEYERLPSTSPAMASLGCEQKLRHWRAILRHLH